ncbi:cytochrome P450 [Aquincola sp. S2]|uniref:Cytochrome P450 n=1 Tax=Pseudaquabacterium terrae TaxID=2732868 RepID=A0ABX2ENV1_9BURK|nr:cytochrome P450 [Aquabacterium terrae]
MKADYTGTMQQLHARHGDAVYMRLGPVRSYCFAHPELVREVLVEKGASFIRWRRAMEVFSRAHGQSVLITEGTPWQRQRRMLQPVFAPKRFEAYAQQMAATGAAGLDALVIAPDGRLDFEQAMTRLTMDVILRTMFGSHAPADAAAVGDAVRVLGHAAMREMFLPFAVPQWVPLPWRRASRRALARLDALIGGVIAQRRARPHEPAGPDDLLAMLMAATDEEGDGAGLADHEVRDQCMTMFLAGHETTASALTWWGWAMAAHPDVAARAAAEVDAVLAGRPPGHADLARLPWLGQTLKETLRLWPPAAGLFTREAIEDVRIGDWLLPAGALAVTTPYVMHRDPRWFPEPERFDPERFAPERAAQLPRGAYLPFGVGPRVCIGNNFALMEMVLLAALMLQRFQFALPAGAPPPRPSLNVSLRPAQRLELVLRRR